MNMAIPSRRECFYVLEMVESGLIDYSYTHPWADGIISEVASAPSWLCDLAVKTYRDDISKALREHMFSEPFEAGPDGLEKFHVACLWLRYERRELSWATFLRLAGEHLDAASGDWHCETPYHCLNVFEGAYFSVQAEEQTKREYLSAQNLRPWIEVAREKYEPFRKVRRVNKAERSGGA